MWETLQALFEPQAARVIGGIAAGVVALGLAALVYAKWRYAQVAGWARTSGRILSSAPGFALVQKFKTEQPRNVRVAKIVYEFETGGRTYRSNRILDTGAHQEDQVERLLKAYPAGAAVTVFHDPRDPTQSALEIDHPPKDLAKGCLAATLIVVVFAAIAIWFVSYGFSSLGVLFPNANLPVMLVTGAVGLLLLLVFIGFHRRASAVRRWPTINGRIVSSGIHQFQQRRDEAKRTMRGRRMMQTMYMPVVEYAYSVGGRDLTSRSIWDGTEVSGSQAYAQSIAARYPVGKTVTVHYDPADPDKTALEVGGYWHWALLVGAVLALGAAAATSGYLF